MVSLQASLGRDFGLAGPHTLLRVLCGMRSGLCCFAMPCWHVAPGPDRESCLSLGCGAWCLTGSASFQKPGSPCPEVDWLFQSFPAHLP